MKIKLQGPESTPGQGLYEMIPELVRIAEPEKILLLSASYQYNLTENIFIDRPEWECLSNQYQVVLLMNSSEKKSWADLEARIHTRMKGCNRISVQFLDLRVFNRQVEEGHHWSGFVQMNAMTLFDRAAGG